MPISNPHDEAPTNSKRTKVQTTPKTGIEALNALPLEFYTSKLCPNLNAQFEPAKYGLSPEYSLHLNFPSSLDPAALNTCFDLIKSTSSADYAASSIGWKSATKRKEMGLPDLRYLTLSKLSKDWDEPLGTNGLPEGFLSFMLTYEDGKEVIYCYELHLRPHLQDKGIGKFLVKMMEDVGVNAGVEKAMLTVFVANEAARAFYKRLGYEEDEFSPRPRKLRKGVVKVPDYIILSKALAGQDRARNEKVGKKRNAG